MELVALEDEGVNAIASFSCTRYSQHGIPHRGSLHVHRDRVVFSSLTHGDEIFFRDIVSVEKSSFLGISTLIAISSSSTSSSTTSQSSKDNENGDSESSADGIRSRYYGSFMLKRSCAIATICHFWLAIRRPPSFLFESSVNHAPRSDDDPYGDDDHSGDNNKKGNKKKKSRIDKMLGGNGGGQQQGARSALFGGFFSKANAGNTSRNPRHQHDVDVDSNDDGLEAIQARTIALQESSEASLQRSIQAAHAAMGCGAATLEELQVQREALLRIDSNLDGMTHNLDEGSKVLSDMERPFLLGVFMPMTKISTTSMGPSDEIQVIPLAESKRRAQVPFLRYYESMLRGKTYYSEAFEFCDDARSFSLCKYTHDGKVNSTATLSHTQDLYISNVTRIIISSVPFKLTVEFENGFDGNGKKSSIVLLSAFRRGIIEEITWRAPNGDIPSVVFEFGAKDIMLRERHGTLIVNRPERISALAMKRPSTNADGINKNSSSLNNNNNSNNNNNRSGQIHQNDHRIDNQVDQLGHAVGMLHAMAVSIGDEVDQQGKIIDSIDSKVDKNQSKLDSHNKRIRKIN